MDSSSARSNPAFAPLTIELTEMPVPVTATNLGPQQNTHLGAQPGIDTSSEQTLDILPTTVTSNENIVVDHHLGVLPERNSSVEPSQHPGRRSTSSNSHTSSNHAQTLRPPATTAGLESGERLLDHHARGPQKPPFWSLLGQTWAQEIIGLCVSAIALVCLGLILAERNHKPVPTGFSLNAVVSALGTIASLAALHTVSSNISQLKWIWIARSSREIKDLSTFEKGGRDELGAAEAIIRGKFHFGTFTVIGWTALVLRLGFDPFLQNVIHFYNTDVRSSTNVGWLSIATKYKAIGTAWEYASMRPDSALNVNMMRSILQPNDSSVNNPASICSTGSCTWGPFATLAFEPSCFDISSNVVREISYREFMGKSYPWFKVNLPDWGPVLEFSGTNMSQGTPDAFLNITAYPGSSDFLVPIRAIRAVVDTSRVGNSACETGLAANSSIVATECSLILTVKSMSAVVKDNVYSEVVHDSWSFPHPNSGYLTDDIEGSPPWDESKGVHQNQTFGIEGNARYAMFRAKALPDRGLAGGVFGADDNCAIRFEPTVSSDEINDLMATIFYTNFTASECDTPEDSFACVFQIATKSINKSVRDADMLQNGTAATDVVRGQVFTSAVFIYVDYIWLSLPLIIWLMGLITFLGTWYRTRLTGVPLWRDNLVPLVFLPGGNEDRSQQRYFDAGFEEMEQAKHVKMRLGIYGKQFRFERSSPI